MTVPEGADPLALAAEVLVAHQRFDIKGCSCGWSDLGKSHPRHVAGVLAAAGLLRDQPVPTRTLIDYRVVWHDGSVTEARGIDYAELLVEDTDGRIEQRDVSVYREAGPWRPVEDRKAVGDVD